MSAGSIIRSAAGLVLLLAAALVSNGGWEGLVGKAPGSLTWGATLFRILLAFHGLLLIVFRPVSRSEAKRQPITRIEWLSISALAAVALVLRLWKLNTCLWLDEVLTLVDFARPPLKEILSSFPNQNQHMLYSILSHWSISTFGEEPWALRLPAVFFGVGSIFALFLLGRKLIGSREALLACGLMTVSYHHIWFSQNARGYTGLLLFSLLGTYLWLEAQERNRWGWWIAYAVSMFAGAWVHMTMVFVVAAHGLIWLCSIRSLRDLDWKPIFAWLLCGTLTLQAYALSLPEFFQSAMKEVDMPSQWTQPLWALTEALRSLRLGFSGVAVVACGAALVALGWINILRRNPRAAFAMVLPGLLGGLAMFALSHNFWPRFFFFSMGFALLIVMEGATALPRMIIPVLPGFRRVLSPAGGAYAVAGLMIAASLLTVPRCYALPKQDYTGARDFAKQMSTPVVTMGLAGHVYEKLYAPQWTVANSVNELEAARQAHPDVTLVYTLPVQLQAFYPELWYVVEKDFEPVKVFPGTLGGGEVYVCRQKPRILPASVLTTSSQHRD